MGWRKRLQFKAVEWLGPWILRLLGTSLRVERHGHEGYLRHRREKQPVVFVFWHRVLLPLAWIHRNEGVVVLVSRHSDGELIARVVERMGFATARGSSTRGGSTGLRQLVRAARSGRDLALTPDGPRGPSGSFKTGALLAAQLQGLPVIPVGVTVDRAWVLSSWDRFVIPKPFTPVHVRYGPAHWIPRDLDREGLKAKAKELGSSMDELTSKAEETP